MLRKGITEKKRTRKDTKQALFKNLSKGPQAGSLLCSLNKKLLLLFLPVLGYNT